MGFLVLARARDFVGGPAGFLGPPFLEPLRPFPANANMCQDFCYNDTNQIK